MTGLGLGVSGAISGVGAAQRDLTDPGAQDIVTKANRALCDALATAPGDFAADWNVAAGAGQVFCAPYYEQNGDTGAQEAPPFTGGQCPGTRYSLRISYEPVGGGNPVELTQGDAFMFGPISGVSVFQIDETSYNWSYSGFTAASGPSRAPKTAQGSGYAGRNARLVNVVVNGSGSNDCGDPPPELMPDPTYSNPRSRQNPGTVNVGGRTINISFGDNEVDIEGSPYVNVDVGGITIPIAFDGGPPSLPAPPAPPAKEGEPSEPSEPSGEVPDALPPEDEEQGFETIGYAWHLTGLDAFDSRIPGTNPVAFATVVGNIALKVETASGSQYWTDTIRIVIQSGLIVRPDPSLKVVAVKYNHVPNIEGIRLTPIRARRRQG